MLFYNLKIILSQDHEKKKKTAAKPIPSGIKNNCGTYILYVDTAKKCINISCIYI